MSLSSGDESCICGKVGLLSGKLEWEGFQQQPGVHVVDLSACSSRNDEGMSDQSRPAEMSERGGLLGREAHVTRAPPACLSSSRRYFTVFYIFFFSEASGFYAAATKAEFRAGRLSFFLSFFKNQFKQRHYVTF